MFNDLYNKFKPYNDLIRLILLSFPFLCKEIEAYRICDLLKLIQNLCFELVIIFWWSFPDCWGKRN